MLDGSCQFRNANAMTTREGLSLRIRQHILAKRMTQQELAAAAGMAPSALSARLRGVREFRISEVEEIANVLGVSLLDLLPAEEKEMQR